MKQVDSISVAELMEMAKKMYGGLVKAVVDIKKGKLVVDANMHADQEAFLLDKGSSQEDLWGINFHPGKFGTEEFIEYDSMVNIRPRQGNMSRNVENEAIRQKIIVLVGKKVKK